MAEDDRRRVAVVHLGRPTARGEARRVESWVRLFEATGAYAQAVPLLGPFARALRGRTLPERAYSVARARTVPETLAWSRPALISHLHAIRPDLVVTVTARAFDPAVAARWPTVLDLVDRLSVSYRDRAPQVAGPARQVGYRALAWSAARFERRVESGVEAARVVAAGWADAEALAVEWVPNVIEPAVPPTAAVHTAPASDVLFFGTLSYPPNIEAVERLARLWPSVLAARPGTTAMVAGAAPSAALRAVAEGVGWQVEADFAALAPLAARCGIAVAPLVHASGIQNKLLDAAVLGLPQVVTPAALAGLAPGFPAVVAADDRALVAGIVGLLDNEQHRRQLAARAATHVADVYGVPRWVPWAQRLLSGA